MKRYGKTLLAPLALAILSGCATTNDPMETVDYVDLERFMGDWFVIASIPTFIERNAHNAVESYRLLEDGSIDTLFTFRTGGFDGNTKRYNPTGFITDRASNAIWGMQFFWPIKADYRIVYLDDAYSTTIIARRARDFVWLMARTPHIADGEYRRLSAFIESLGYDISKLKRVPQQWPSAGQDKS